VKTGTRRFVLRLIVGLLTFLIGVFAALVLGNFNPLEGHHARVRARRCAEYSRPAPPPSSITVPVLPPDTPVAPRVIYPVYRAESRLGKTPLPRQMPVEPVLPSFEDEGEVKTPKPVAPSHRSR
jgi:hypothetical protein